MGRDHETQLGKNIFIIILRCTVIYYDYNLNLLIFKDEIGDLKENVSLEFIT